MKDYTALRSLVESYLAANFTEVPIIFENCKIAADLKEFVMVEDQVVSTSPIAIGFPGHISQSSLAFSICTEIGVGTQRSKHLATTIVEILEAFEVEGVDFDEPTLMSEAYSSDATYFIQILQFPYTTSIGGV